MKNKTNIWEQKTLPHDEETEHAVLSALIVYNDKFNQYGDILEPNLFYQEKEKAIFRCVAGVINDGGVTDVNSLWNYSQSHDVGYELFRNDFVEVIQKLNKVTIEQDIMRLREMGRRRLCWRLLQETSQRFLDLTVDFDDEIGVLTNIVGEVMSETGSNGIVSNDETLDELMENVENNRKGIRHSLTTGYRLFDEKYLLRPEMLTVIAAFTSVGKSALALNIIHSVARQGVPCAYYSLEMSRMELASRCISKDAGMTSSSIMNKSLSDDKVKKLADAIKGEKGLPIYYDDRSTVNFDRTIRSIRTMVKTKDVRLVVIDYLQVYAQQSDDQEKSISYMARTAKNVAKELGICIILISQLNRSALHPTIKMLRGSGQIEESADNIVLIDRPEAYPDNKVSKYEGEFKDSSIFGTAKLILAKGRGVGTGSQLVAFDKEHTLFHEIQKPEDAGHNDDQEEPMPF